jgi:endonuclease YncB( thermonuclease family)
MDGWTWIVFIIAAIVVLLAILAKPNADEIVVLDGDTVQIGTERLRLFGIDAPESKQPYGAQSKKALAAAIAAAGPNLRIARREKDRYGRTIAILYDGKRSINAAMVEGGNAWSYRDYSLAYVDHEARARAALRGLWGVPGCPQAPWQWRHG